jgi:hypothetical protein
MTEIEFLIYLKKLALNEDISEGFVGLEHINEIFFSFEGEGKYICFSIEEWIEMLHKKGMKQLRLIIPVEDNTDYNKAGFANGIRKGLFCEYDGFNTLWQSFWSFDNELKKWNIKIVETKVDWSSERYEYASNYESFLKVLIEIESLANKIDCEMFANCFRKAIDILQDKSIDVGERLRQAARNANVFGGMGSWNDSPPYLAHTKGLGEEYDKLTAELYRQIQFAVVSTNE